MTRMEKLKACKAQFVFPDFMDVYRPQLDKLRKNRAFMTHIRRYSEKTEETLLFGANTGVDSARFQQFKNTFCDDFYRTLSFASYPEYGEIYRDVKAKNREGKSATISVFYAMVYLDVLTENPPDHESPLLGFLKRLLWGKDTPDETVPAHEGARKQERPEQKVKKEIRCSSQLRFEFEKYLIQQNYSQYTPSGLPSTVYAYIKAVDEVCETELLDWAGLADKIDEIILMYDVGGIRERQGNRGHRTVINALYRYREFCR